jgi:hypothetical protein
VLADFARQFKPLCSPKTGFYAGLSSLLLLAGAGSVQDASARNETRTLSFHHTHSGEDLTVTFKRDGRYDEDALKQLNHFLRDWRSQEKTEMDRRLFDILWEVYRDVDGKQPINIISSYRSPATNVGFYPTSGSPFVHLDTGSVRHWPRMTPDQLAKVFPDGRTVHQSTSGPMKGYELARAELDRRGNGDDAGSSKKPSFLAALFGGKSAPSEEDDEGPTSAPAAKNEKPAKPTVVAAAKSADPVPVPRAKPGATLQLASANAEIVPAPKAKSAPVADKTEPRPQTPADIINARGFWDNVPAAPQQATPAQVAALNARKALNSADPQPTASVAENFNKALAYAPAAAPATERANVVAASAPIPSSARPASRSRNSMAVNDVTSVVAKGAQGSVQGQASVIATSTRLASAKGSDVWMRVMMLAPSASTSMSVTVLGDADMTLMRSYFVKPQAIVAMTFSDDPMLGVVTERFTGSATARLETQSFVMRTASLR